MVTKLIQRIRDQDTSPDGALGKQAVACVVDMQIQWWFQQLLADGIWKGITGLEEDVRLILLQRTDADEPPPDLVRLIRDAVWSLLEEASYPKPEQNQPKTIPAADHPRSPAGPSRERLELDEGCKQFRIDSRWYDYKGGHASYFLSTLLKAAGRWEPGSNLVPKSDSASGEIPRADRVLRLLRAPIRKIIEVRRGYHGGYRIKPEYFRIAE